MNSHQFHKTKICTFITHNQISSPIHSLILFDKPHNDKMQSSPAPIWNWKVWEQELYLELVYTHTVDLFHTFEAEHGMAGLSFADPG